MPPTLPSDLLQKYGSRVQFIKSRHGDGIRFSVEKQEEAVAQTQQIITFFEHLIKPQNAIV